MILASLVSLGQAGCGGGHDHDHSEAGPHHHDPPHGGAGVRLGDEEAHIEFLVDAEAGTVTAWFFKPHMERYLRIKAESFVVLAKLPDGEARLIFAAVSQRRHWRDRRRHVTVRGQGRLAGWRGVVRCGLARGEHSGHGLSKHSVQLSEG